MVKRMEINQSKEKIKKVSHFLSEMHIAHYTDSLTIHVPGKVVLVSIDQPAEIKVEQDSGMSVRILKDHDKIYIEAWKGIDGVTYGDAMTGIDVVYYDGELEIRFLGEQNGDN